MAKIMPQITSTATSTADVPTQKFAGVESADAGKLVVVTSDPTTGDTFDYTAASAITADGWDASSAPTIATEAAYTKVEIGGELEATRAGDAAITVRSGGATSNAKVSLGTNANKATVAVPGAADTYFTDTAQGDLVLRADDNNNKIHLGAGTSGKAGMVVTEVANVGKIGVGTASPGVQLEVQDTTATSATQGGNLRLSANDGAVMAASHRLGVVEFGGAEDAGGSITVGARIESVADATWSASENGANMDFYTTDGDAAQTKQMSILNGTAGNVTLGGDRDLMYGALTTSKKLTVYGTAERSVLELGSSKSGNGEPMGAVHFINNDNADATNFDADSKVIGLMQMETVTTDSNAGDDSGGKFTLSTKPEAGTIAARLTVLSAGDVGIGVADPDTKLEILDAASTQLKLSFDGTDNCTLGVDTNGMLTVTPSGGMITNTAANGVINSAALMSKGPHTHPDRFVKNTAAPTHGSGTTANWAFVDSSNYTNSQLTAPSTSANAIRLFKWQPSAAYTDGKNYAIVLPTLDATWTSSSNYLRYRVVIQQDTAMSSVSTGVQLQLGAAGGSDTINGSTSNYVIKNIAVTNPSAYDWTVDVIGYFDGSKTIWEVVQHAQWG